MKREEIIDALMKANEQVNKIWMQSLVLNDEAETRQEFADFESLDTITFDAFDYWLGDEAAEQKLNPAFAKFGIRNDGSLVAVWLREDKDFVNAPVVIIGGEGDLDIVAPDYLTFIVLSCLGYDMYQMLNFEKDGAKPWKEKNQYALEHILSGFGLSVPDDIAAMIQKARADNPNVQEYIASFKAS